jgi:citrate/tricarballylate utilization protein
MYTPRRPSGGCHNQDDAFTLARRRIHHLTFYGFLLCFLSTSIAAIYHYFFKLEAPYAYMSIRGRTVREGPPHRF